MKQQTVAIVGVGMMGGSLGLALRKGRKARVVGIGRNLSKLKAARKLGAVDEISTDFPGVVRKADIVVLCTTVDQLVPSFQRILPGLKSGAVVTDIGGVKASVLEGVRKALASRPGGQIHFVGSHPLAGSEKMGARNARADLYENAAVAVCPMDSTPSTVLNRVKSFWASVGARPLVLPADFHDILVAQTSHLPHVLAAALVQLVSGLCHRDPDAAKLLAGSFQDMTRIADSDPRQWAEISRANRKFLIGAVRSYRDVLNRILQKVEASPDSLAPWEDFFSSARDGRKALLARNPKFK